MPKRLAVRGKGEVMRTSGRRRGIEALEATGVGALVVALLLSGCTGPDDRAEAPASSGQGTTAAPEPTSSVPTEANVEPEPGLYRVDPTTGETEALLTVRDPREPETSPDGSKLVFQNTGPGGTQQIYLLEDGEAHRLTDLPGGAAEPTWSPDGSQIAFAGARSRAEDPDIYVMGADGSDIHVLARTAENDRRPDWSPDGSRIVFDTYGAIWMASVEDGHVTRIRVSTPQGYPAAPVWSPNGRWIVVTGYDAHTMNGIVHITRLWIARPDGSGRRPLGGGEPSFWDWEMDPSWSPTGSSIAFVGGKGEGPEGRGRYGLEVGIMDVRSGEVRYLPTSLRAWDLSWDAEGLVIAHLRVGALPSPPISGVTVRSTRDPWRVG